MSKTKNLSTISNKKKRSSFNENDPFADALSPKKFMEEIRKIRESNDPKDVNLRKAATDYMSNLRYV